MSIAEMLKRLQVKYKMEPNTFIIAANIYTLGTGTQAATALCQWTHGTFLA
jgi:hypothetical protein